MFLLSCTIISKINNNEIVMQNGMEIKAINENGTIHIKAGNNLSRIYSWNNKKIELNLIPRMERWYGSLGIYSPRGNKDIHAVVEEGHQYFCSVREALEWLTWGNQRKKYVYTCDGLVVGWYVTHDPNSSKSVLNVEVWQFLISGEKPINLPEARDDLIIVKNRHVNDIQSESTFVQNCPKEIDGRVYSGKALDYMEERNIKSAHVESAINNGTIIEKYPFITYFIRGDREVGYLWVKVDETGRVVLLGK